MTDSQVGIASGRSYYLDGSTFKDSYALSNPSTIFIKAYTKNTDQIPSVEPSEVTYKVRHYQEKLDGTYELKDTDTLKGVMGSTVTPSTRTYQGFTSPSRKSVKLDRDNITIEYKYTRNSYTVTLNKGNGISSVSGGKSYKYGETVVIDAVVSSGYTWKEWEGNPSVTTKRYSFTMPSYNVTYKAMADRESVPTPSPSEVTYKVRHYQEKLDGTYELKDTDTLTGVMGSTVSPNTKSYQGFISPNKKSIKLEGNNQVVEYKYDRERHTVTLEMGVGIKDVSGGGTYKYGSSVTIDAELSSGYSFLRWKGTPSVIKKRYTFTMGDHDITYKAMAIKNGSSGVPVNGVVILGCPSSKIKVLDVIELSSRISSDGATNKEVVWSVSNSGVITVNSSGKVNTIGSGKSSVTVLTKDGGYQARCDIEVEDISSNNPPKSSSKEEITLKIDKSEVSLIKGNEYKLSATVTGSTGKIIWTSKNKNIVSVENGLLKGISEGNTEVVAKVDGTNVSKSIKVSVIDKEEKGIKLASKEINIYLNHEEKIEIITIPTNMEIEKIKYEVENEEVVLLSDGIVRGLKEGKTKIRVIVNGKYKAEGIINVLSEPLIINVASYELNFDENRYSYVLRIGNEKSLVITSNKDIEVSGNQELKNNSIIKIIEKEDNREYTIKIVKNNNISYYLFGGILVLVIIISLIIIKKRNNN